MKQRKLLLVLQLITLLILASCQNEKEIVTVVNNRTLSNTSSENITDEDYMDFITTDTPETTTVSISHDVNIPRALGKEKWCTCDLTADSCDINCCCDEDCSSSDRNVFMFCKTRSLRYPDDNYCIQERLLFATNTEYETVMKSDNMMCIVRDNLKDSKLFPEMKGVNTVDELQKFESLSKIFSWYQESSEANEFLKSNVYGSPVWIIDKGGLAHKFELPASFLYAFCENKQNIMYLQDYETICHVKVDNITQQCTEELVFSVEPYLKLLFKGKLREKKDIDKNASTTTQEPSNQNSTSNPVIEENVTKAPHIGENKTKLSIEGRRAKLQKLEPGVFYLSNFDIVPVTLMSCEFVDGISTPCTENKILPPTYIEGFCQNVLKSIEFIIIHNGTAGIQEVVTKFVLGSVGLNTETFRQSFKVNFQWIQDKDTVSFPRSGRPGYIVGKPILFGKLIVNDTNEEPLNSYIEIDIDPTNWFDISSPSTNMNCDNLRMPINFGENVHSGCLMNVSLGSCQIIQKQIFSELFEIDRLSDLLEGSSKIGMFGDSNKNNIHEWISLIVADELKDALSNEVEEEKTASILCENIIFGLEIKIYYAYQGLFSDPQAKIIGAFVGKGLQTDLNLVRNDGLLLSKKRYTESIIEISSMVTFVNAGKAAIQQYPDAPSFDVKLPSDFFYPFLSSKSSCVLQDSVLRIISHFFIHLIWLSL